MYIHTFPWHSINLVSVSLVLSSDRYFSRKASTVSTCVLCFSANCKALEYVGREDNTVM